MVAINPTIETVTSARKTYTVDSPDTSQITAVVADGIAVITLGGMELNVPIACLSVLANLVDSLAVQNPPPPPALVGTGFLSSIGVLKSA